MSCWKLARISILVVVWVVFAGCARHVVPTAPVDLSRDAVLILPGLGYGRSGHSAMQKFRKQAALKRFDVYVADIHARDGLNAGRKNLQRFVRTHRLLEYRRLYVFAFIAGAFVVNPILTKKQFPNLAAVVYDRSPTQERAPFVATEQLGFIVRLLYGELIFEIARTPYPRPARTDIPIGLMIETRRTGIMRRYEKLALTKGPYDFRPDSLGVKFDDYAYVPYNHDEMYEYFERIGPAALAFFRMGKFPAGSQRKPPVKEPPAPR